jgi:hypothetical protein
VNDHAWQLQGDGACFLHPPITDLHAGRQGGGARLEAGERYSCGGLRLGEWAEQVSDPSGCVA